MAKKPEHVKEYESRLRELYKKHGIPLNGVDVSYYDTCIQPCCYSNAGRDADFVSDVKALDAELDHYTFIAVGSIDDIESYVIWYWKETCVHEYKPEGAPSMTSIGMKTYYRCTLCPAGKYAN